MSEPLRPAHEVIREPAKCRQPEDMTQENLANDVADWERAVRSFEAGFDCHEEYTHDLFFRECLHDTLNGFASQGLVVPGELQDRVDAADRRFIELTKEVAHDVWGGAHCYEPGVFWYYFRVLIQ